MEAMLDVALSVFMYLDHVVSHRSGEYDVCQEPGIVTGAQTDLHQPLPVAQHQELGQLDIGRHLDGGVSVLPGVLEVRHGVAETFYLYCAHLRVQGEVC